MLQHLAWSPKSISHLPYHFMAVRSEWGKLVTSKTSFKIPYSDKTIQKLQQHFPEGALFAVLFLTLPNAFSSSTKLHRLSALFESIEYVVRMSSRCFSGTCTLQEPFSLACMNAGLNRLNADPVTAPRVTYWSGPGEGP